MTDFAEGWEPDGKVARRLQLLGYVNLPLLTTPWHAMNADQRVAHEHITAAMADLLHGYDSAPPTFERIDPASVAMTWTGDRIVGATERRPDGTVSTWGTHRPRAEQQQQRHIDNTDTNRWRFMPRKWRYVYADGERAERRRVDDAGPAIRRRVVRRRR